MTTPSPRQNGLLWLNDLHHALSLPHHPPPRMLPNGDAGRTLPQMIALINNDQADDAITHCKNAA